MTKDEILERAIKAAQKSMGLTPDGDFGKVSTAKAADFDFEFTCIATKKETPVLLPTDSDWFGATWTGSYINLLGRYETDPVLNAALVPEWPKEGLPSFKTLAGNDHAWCSVLVNASFRKVGIVPTNSAAAASWRTWGVVCPYWFGAVISMQHAGGGNHVGFFLYWIDEKKKIAAIYSGNSGNRLCVAAYDLSGVGRGNKVMGGGPRAPKGWVGQSPTMAQVLAKYPQLKVGGTSETTR